MNHLWKSTLNICKMNGLTFAWLGKNEKEGDVNIPCKTTNDEFPAATSWCKVGVPSSVSIWTGKLSYTYLSRHCLKLQTLLLLFFRFDWQKVYHLNYLFVQFLDQCRIWKDFGIKHQSFRNIYPEFPSSGRCYNQDCQ